MSGHSKWSKIKRQKGIADLKKGELFTKCGKAITVAVREGGADMSMNFVLRMAIDKAKAVNMPKSTIERAVKKGLGQGDVQVLEDITYEIIGQDGICLLVDCLTDNKNRAISEIRKVIAKSSFKIGEGSVRWLFAEKGQIVLEPLVESEILSKGRKQINYTKIDKESLVLEIMGFDGVEDVENDYGVDRVVCVLTKKAQFQGVGEKLKKKKVRIIEAGMVKIAKNRVDVNEKGCRAVEDIVSRLEENPDVVAVWSNL